jgi:tRNA threonylcarbamoyladenosine biosynthesis protein TsaB
MVDELLSEAQSSLRDLDAIAFGRGPGSFTGVRLAATVTQGLAFGAGLGVVPVSDLQAVAQRAFAMDAGLERVVVCNAARMSEVYWGCYERGADGLARLEGEEHVGKPSDVRLPAGWTTARAVGRGFVAYAEALRAALPGVLVDPDALTGGDLAAATAGTARGAPAAAAEAAAAEAAGPTATTARAAPGGAATEYPLDRATAQEAAALTSLLPRAAEIALLAVPRVAAGQLLPPEGAIPVYLRDNVAHVAQPPKPPG